MTAASREFSTAKTLTPKEKFLSDRGFYYRIVEKGFKKGLFTRAQRDFLRKEVSLWFHHRNDDRGYLYYPIEYFVKALRLAERSARRIRKWCIEAGFVVVKGYAKGGRSRAVHYIIDLDAISNFVEPPPAVIDGELEAVRDAFPDDMPEPEYDENGVPFVDARDMADFAPEALENGAYRPVLTDGKPCQNGRRIYRSQQEPLHLHGSILTHLLHKSRWLDRAPIRLFGLHGGKFLGRHQRSATEFANA